MKAMKDKGRHIGQKPGFKLIPWKLSDYVDKRKVRRRRGETVEEALTRQLRGLSEEEQRQFIFRLGEPK